MLFHAAKHNSGQRLNLRADSSLELNVTRAFVETLMNTLEVSLVPTFSSE